MVNYERQIWRDVTETSIRPVTIYHVVLLHKESILYWNFLTFVRRYLWPY